jgi:hypothetical protein
MHPIWVDVVAAVRTLMGTFSTGTTEDLQRSGSLLAAIAKLETHDRGATTGRRYNIPAQRVQPRPEQAIGGSQSLRTLSDSVDAWSSQSLPSSSTWTAYWSTPPRP